METAEADGGPNEEVAAFRGGEHEDWEALLTRTDPDLSAREPEAGRRRRSSRAIVSRTDRVRLFLSPSTVRNHLSSIFHKIDVGSQAQMVETLHASRNDHHPE